MADKRSDSSEQELEAAVRPLVSDGIKIIPVFFGSETDSKELELVSSTPRKVIKANDSVSADKLADHLIDVALHGKKICN